MLKRFRIYYFLLSSFIVISSCDNDLPLPTPTQGDVVFELSAIIDGKLENWEAGLDNQYMYTYTTQDSNEVVQFQGTLSEQGCQFCPNAINFAFNQSQSSSSIDELFTNNQNNINYQNAMIPIEIVGYNTIFDLNLNGTAPYVFNWNFGDGTTLVNSNNSVVEHQYSESGNYNVCIEIIDAIGCKTKTCRTIATDNSMHCAVNFSVHELGNNFANSFYFYTYSAGAPPFNYQWNVPLDNSNSQNFTVSTPTVTVNQLGTMDVQVDMTDADNCTCSLTQAVNFHNLDSSCINHFDYFSQAILEPGISQDYYSTLTIQYIDDDGRTYSSALGEQPISSFINILNIEEFEINLEGLPTKKITLEFTCRLFDEDGNFKDLTDGSGTIALAYK